MTGKPEMRGERTAALTPIPSLLEAYFSHMVIADRNLWIERLNWSEIVLTAANLHLYFRNQLILVKSETSATSQLS